ncbi:MAG: rubrerythrin family protein [Desulfobacteraceae bacterium]|nr:rubrerythrin family protein [Desulfobacteraceae bacterium]
MKNNIEEMLLRTYGLLTKAAARKTTYAKRAVRDGRKGVGHLIRAITESEKIQAHRILSAYRGHIDLSEKYLSTLFEKEVEEVITQYTKDLSEAKTGDNKAILHALTQSLVVEKHTRAYYSSEEKDVSKDRDRSYHVCIFCGYIIESPLPDSCPVCGAARDSFKEVI